MIGMPDNSEFDDLGDLERQLNEVETAEVVEFSPKRIKDHLGSRDFKSKFNSHLKRAFSEAGVEQGFWVCSTLNRKKLSNREIAAADFDTSYLGLEDLEEEGLVPLLLVHFHSTGGEGIFPSRVGTGYPVDYLKKFYPFHPPSDSDLRQPPSIWHPSVDEDSRLQGAVALIVGSSYPDLWLWQRPEEEKLVHILNEYREWERTLDPRRIDEQEAEVLKQTLKDAGLKLTTVQLNPKNPHQTFVQAFQKSGIGLGFS